MHRRKFLGLSLKTSALLALAACGKSSTATPTTGISITGPTATPNPSQPPSSPSPSPTTVPSASPTVSVVSTPIATQVSGAATPSVLGVLRWANTGISEPSSIDPANPKDAQSILIINLVFSGLVKLNEKLEVVPDAAESWKVSKDGTVYTFKLRTGLKYADGSECTAEDFAYAINRALTPTTQSFAAPFQLQDILGAKDVASGKAKEAKGVRVIDKQTLEITLERPIAYFLDLMTFPYSFAAPRKLVESGKDWTNKAFGTGPFRIKEWKHNQSMTLEPNPYYWQGKPQINIQMPFIQNSETAYQLYQTGQLDITGGGQDGIPAQEIPNVKGKPDYKEVPALAVRYIGFNNKLKPFDDVHVRRAFAFATDRNTLAEKVLGGTVHATDRILPQGIPGSDLPVKGLEYDPDKAKQELKLAGIDPSSINVTLAYGQEGDNERVVEALQSMWQTNLGVKVNLQPMELGTFSKNLDVTRENPTKGLQFYLSIWGADYPDPQNFLSQQLQTESPNNNGHWSNKKFDELTEKADIMSASSQFKERLRLYNQAEQIAINEVGWLPLYNPLVTALIRPSVKGLVLTGQGIMAPDWSKVTV